MFNEIYKKLKIEDKGNEQLDKFILYCELRNIQDEEYEDDFIEELYGCYEYILNEIIQDYSYGISDFIYYINSITNKLKISIKDIDLDEMIKEMEEF